MAIGRDRWTATPARWVLAALLWLGWRIVRQKGCHRLLVRDGHRATVFAFREREIIGPVMLARIARATGLRADDLQELP